jgi:hypothetical protein
MNSMLATDTPDTPEAVPASVAAPILPLEIHAQNERMRHIPSLEWMLGKLEGDARKRAGLMLDVLHALPGDDTRHAELEGALRLLSRSLDRLTEAARHGRTNHAPNEIGAHLRWSLEHAAANLRSLDGETFGRRAPFHHFERSRSEPVYGAFLSVLAAIERALAIASAADRSLDERLYAHLVHLETPLRREPIAIP